MNKFIVHISFIFVLVTSTFLPTVIGQKGKEIGGWLGTSYYFGDLNTSLRIVKPGLAAGLNFRYNFDHRISVKSSINYGRVGGDDKLSSNNYERNRNLSFRSDIVDWSNVIEFNFFHYEHGHRQYNRTPYVFAGFNVFGFSPTAELEGTRYKLRGLGTEGQGLGSEYRSVSGGFILGGGLKWDINKDFSVNIEASTRFLLTDFLDDVSGIFPDKANLLTRRGAIAVSLSDRSLIEGIGDAGRQRGDSKGTDKYTFVGISVMRYFGGIECPKISQPH
jgi:hypothetical protein